MNEDKDKVWERLKYVPMPQFDIGNNDISSMYPAAMTVFNISKVEGDPLNVKLKVLKNRQYGPLK